MNKHCYNESLYSLVLIYIYTSGSVNNVYVRIEMVGCLILWSILTALTAFQHACSRKEDKTNACKRNVKWTFVDKVILDLHTYIIPYDNKR